ncbi:MAG: helix-turn-helix domain-containing protein [Christensenellales bacterium]
MEEHNVGRLIATLRKSKGWTQVELAEKLQVSDKTISKWESGADCRKYHSFRPCRNYLTSASIIL